MSARSTAGVNAARSRMSAQLGGSGDCNLRVTRMDGQSRSVPGVEPKALDPEQAIKMQRAALETRTAFVIKDAYVNELRRSQYAQLGCLVWTIFLLICLFMWYSIQTPEGRYKMNAALIDMFYHDEFEGEDHLWMSFPEIQNIGEFKGWMYGPMYNALYGEIDRTDAHNSTFFFPGQLASAAPLIIHGAPLLRQVRGVAYQCGQSQLSGHLCYADPVGGDSPLLTSAAAEKSAEDTEPFGGPAGDRYHWSSIEHLRLRSAAGQLVFSGQYGAGGYFVPMPRDNATAGLELLDQLWEDDWIDAATRAVFLYVNVWSPATNQISTLQFLCEFFASGKVIGSPRVLSQPIEWSGYGGSSTAAHLSDGDPVIVGGLAVVLCYGILAICICTAGLWVLIGFRQHGVYNFLQGTMYVDLLTLLLLLTLVFYRLVLTADDAYMTLLENGRWSSGGAKFREQLNDPNVKTKLCTDDERRCPCLQEEAWHEDGTQTWLGSPTCDVEFTVRVAAGLQDWLALLRIYTVVMFLVLVKVGQYVRVFSRPNIIVTTMLRAMPDLVTYMLIFIVIVFVFIWTGFVIFGNVVDSYRSVTQAIRTCMFMVIGDMANYDNSVLFFPEVAPFSMLYISVVTLVLLNMLIAILTEYFETMKEEERALSGGRAGIIGNTIQEYAKMIQFTLSDDLPTVAVEPHALVQLVPRPEDLPPGARVALWSLKMPIDKEEAKSSVLKKATPSVRDTRDTRHATHATRTRDTHTPVARMRARHARHAHAMALARHLVAPHPSSKRG